MWKKDAYVSRYQSVEYCIGLGCKSINIPFPSSRSGCEADQTKIGGCLLLLQSWAWDRIKCIVSKIDHISMEEVQEGLEFPFARRWSWPMTQTNITTNSVKLIHVIFDRLHMNEIYFLILMSWVFFFSVSYLNLNMWQ